MEELRLPITESMTTVEGRDTETATRMALAAIEQMFGEAMTCIGALCEGFSATSDEQNADDAQDSSVDPAQKHASTEEIPCQAAA